MTKKKAKGRKEQTPEQEEAIRNLMTAHERLSRFIMNHIWANDDLINVLKLTNGQLAIWKGAAEESRRYQCALRHRLESMFPEVIDKYRPCEEENGKCYRNEGAVQ